MSDEAKTPLRPSLLTALTLIANTILCGAAFFFGAALVWAFLRSERYPPGSMNDYYYVFGCGVAVCLFSLRLRPGNRAKAALLTISAIMTLYLAEVILNLIRPTQNPRLVAAEAMGVSFDTRPKAEVLAALAALGIKSSPLVPPIFFAATDGLRTADGDHLYPLGNISGDHVVDCNESGAFSAYDADEYGYNNPRGSLNLATVDVALVGDSFAIGSCVGQGLDIGSRLRRGGTSVINLSNAGNGPLLELATLTEYATSQSPKVVFWLFFEGNDPSDILLERESAILLAYLEEGYSQNLKERQPEIDRVLENYIAGQADDLEGNGIVYTLVSIAKLSTLRSTIGLELPAPKLSPLFREALKKAATRTRAWGGEFYFVYLPDWTRYTGKKLRANPVHRDRVLAVVDDLAIPTIDLHPAFEAHADPLSLFPFRIRGHYSSEGFELVTKELRSILGHHKLD